MNYYEAMNTKGQLPLIPPLPCSLSPPNPPSHHDVDELFLCVLSSADFVFALITDHLEEATSILTTDYSFHHWVGK